MDNYLDPKPCFPRLLGRSIKRPAVKKASPPSSAYLADIARDSAPFPLPSLKRTKRKNAFMKAFTKAMPCVSGRGHQPDSDQAFDSNTAPIIEKSPRSSLRGLGIQDTKVDPAFQPITTTTTAPVATLSPDYDTTNAYTTSSGIEEQNATALGGFVRNTNYPIPNMPNPSPAPRTPSPPASLKSRPSSLSSIPSSILGEDLSEKTGAGSLPLPNDDVQPLLDTIVAALKQIQAVVDQQPAVTADFLRSFAGIQKDFRSLFAPGLEEDNESLGGDSNSDYGVEHVDEEEDTFQLDESAWLKGSNVPTLILSLPTEPDLVEGETTIVDDDAKPVSPELLSTKWLPTPRAVKRWRAMAAAKRQQDFKLRKATSVPDLAPVASAFDMDVNDEDDEYQTISSDRKYMDSVSSRIASESKRGLGIVPDGFLPSREALASRLKKIPAVVSDAEKPAIDATPPAPLMPIVEDEECESILSPALASRNADSSVCGAEVPSSPLVGNLSAWTFMEQLKSRRLSITQAGEPPVRVPEPVVIEVPTPEPVIVEVPAPEPVVVEVPAPKPRPASMDLSARRMSRRSDYYKRVNDVWVEKVLSKSDLSSRSHSTGFRGIRPLVLPTRVARRESREGTGSGSGSSTQDSRRSSLADSHTAPDTGLPVSHDSFNAVAAVAAEETPSMVHSPATAAAPPATSRYNYF